MRGSSMGSRKANRLSLVIVPGGSVDLRLSQGGGMKL
jgi:hypothetical protein